MNKPIDINKVETGKEFFELLQKINFAGCVGVKTEADAEKLLKGLKAAGTPSRP